MKNIIILASVLPIISCKNNTKSTEGASKYIDQVNVKKFIYSMNKPADFDKMPKSPKFLN